MYILSCRDTELTRSREFYASVNSPFLSRFIVSRCVQIKSTFRLQTQDFNSCPVSCRNVTSAQVEEKVFHCDSALVKRKQAIQPQIHVLGCRWVLCLAKRQESARTGAALTGTLLLAAMQLPPFCPFVSANGRTNPPQRQALMTTHSHHGGLANLFVGTCLLS